jgi:hypothetical protein
MNPKLAIRILLVVLVFLLAGCSGLGNQAGEAEQTLPPTQAPTATPQPTPITQEVEDILSASAAAMQQVNSMQFTIETTVEAVGQSITSTGQGALQNPDNLYMKLDILGNTVEFLILGAEGSYIKLPGATEFTEMTQNDIATLGEPPDIKAQMDMGKFASRSSLQGEETLNGIPTYVISFDLDMPRYLADNPDSSGMLDAANASGVGKMWIGKDDDLLYQMTMEIKSASETLPVGITNTFTFFGFNEPVEIPQP